MLSYEELFAVCPFATAQKILSGKWALYILYKLSGGKYRFNELQRELPNMTQTTLTRQLRQLEEYNMITRTVYAQIPPKVEYELSESGVDFLEVLKALEVWGNKYIERVKESMPQEKIIIK